MVWLLTAWLVMATGTFGFGYWLNRPLPRWAKSWSLALVLTVTCLLAWPWVLVDYVREFLGKTGTGAKIG